MKNCNYTRVKPSGLCFILGLSWHQYSRGVHSRSCFFTKGDLVSPRCCPLWYQEEISQPAVWNDAMPCVLSSQITMEAANDFWHVHGWHGTSESALHRWMGCSWPGSRCLRLPAISQARCSACRLLALWLSQELQGPAFVVWELTRDRGASGVSARSAMHLQPSLRRSTWDLSWDSGRFPLFCCRRCSSGCKWLLTMWHVFATSVSNGSKGPKRR